MDSAEAFESRQLPGVLARFLADLGTTFRSVGGCDLALLLRRSRGTLKSSKALCVLCLCSLMILPFLVHLILFDLVITLC